MEEPVLKCAVGAVGGGAGAGGAAFVSNLINLGEISRADLRKFFLSQDGGGYSEMAVNDFFDKLWEFFDSKDVNALNKKKDIVTLDVKWLGKVPIINDKYNLRNDLIQLNKHLRDKWNGVAQNTIIGAGVGLLSALPQDEKVI